MNTYAIAKPDSAPEEGRLGVQNIMNVQRQPLYLNDPMDMPEELKGTPESQDTTPPKEPENQTSTDTWEKRYGDLKSYMDKQINSMKKSLSDQAEEKKRLEQQLKEAQTKPLKLPKTKEELEAFRAEYPDVLDTMFTVARMEASEGVKGIEEKLEELRAKTKAYEAEKGKQLLRELHPDFEELNTDPKFGEWFHASPRSVQLMIESDDVYTVAAALDLFKAKTGRKTPSEKKEESKAAAKSVNVNSTVEPTSDKKIWKESEIHRMTPNQYAKVSSEIDQAMKEGRVLIGQ